MTRIYKYTLEVESRQLITMPIGAKPLSLAVQNEIPCLFAEVDENITEFESRVFRTVTTGEIFNTEDLSFIGTVIVKDWYTLHLYEQPTPGKPDPISDRFIPDMIQLKDELNA